MKQRIFILVWLLASCSGCSSSWQQNLLNASNRIGDLNDLNTFLSTDADKVTNRISPARLTAGAGQIEYEGYSDDFQSVKEDLQKGDLDSVRAHYEWKFSDETTPEEYMDDAGMLGLWENASLKLTEGNTGGAIEDFNYSRQILEDEYDKSVAREKIEKAADYIYSSVIGDGDFGDYSAESYEKILMLNLTSVAYMLEGDRKAYNVARRAIDWQNIERKKFEEKRKKLQKALKKEEKKQKEKGISFGRLNIAKTISDYYKKLNRLAENVPSAYVNPFGDYLSGVIQEFESYEDHSIRDNAKISYEKALKLNPTSSVIKASIAAVKKSPPKNRQLIHVIVADGLAPEKKVLNFSISGSDEDLPVKLPIIEPVESKIASLSLTNSNGATLTRFAPVASIELLALRHQKDSLSEHILNVTIGITRAFFHRRGIKYLASNLVGKGLAGLLDSSTKDFLAEVPDTRTWMSLPSKIYAARFFAPVSLKNMKIVAYDRNKRRIASANVKLNNSDRNFIFARTIDSNIYAQSSEHLWAEAK